MEFENENYLTPSYYPIEFELDVEDFVYDVIDEGEM